MKKFLLMAMLAVAACTLVSCEDNDAVTYCVTVTGDAIGDVDLTFPDGELKVDGTAGLNFKYGNVEPNSGAVLATKGSKYVKAKEAVLADFDERFSATSAGGTYYLHIEGYAEAYGVKVVIDQTLTNRE